MAFPQSPFRLGGGGGWGGDRREGSFVERWLWPPRPLVIIAGAVVVSLLLGVCGGLVYTRSETGQIRAVPPDADLLPEAVEVTTTDPSKAPTTTTTPDLSPAALATKVAPSVWSVSTLDEAGRPVEGSGFVVAASGGQSLLLTSLAVVRAATRAPGPVISVRNGSRSVEATLWSWQEDRDLALLTVPGASPVLRWAERAPEPGAGGSVYAAPAGGGVTPGALSAVSPVGLEHNILTDDRHQGAPLVDPKGQVLGMLSREYNPGGAGTDRLFFAVPVRTACERVIRCGTESRPRPTTTSTRPGAPLTTRPR